MQEFPPFYFGETSYDERDGGFTRYVYFFSTPPTETGSYSMTFQYQGEPYRNSLMQWHSDGTLTWETATD